MRDFQAFRLQLVRESAPVAPIVSGPTQVADQLKPMFEGLDREHFVVLAFDARMRPIGCNTVSIGSLSAAIVHPREVFKFAILANASALICAHNHPSGDPGPSKEDIELMRRLMKAGEILGIDVLDSVIFGGDDVVSMKERGLI